MKIPPHIESRIKRHANIDASTSVWTSSQEDSWLIILEAFNRYLDVTQDERQAGLLTMAFASLEGGSRGHY